jgi:GNAT superfamily N-acetyltransferase
MTSFYMRSLTMADQSFLWDILYHAVYVPKGEQPPPIEIVNEPGVAKYARGWGHDGDCGFAAIDVASSQPIGAVWNRLFTRNDPGYGFIDENIPEVSIALYPEFRNQGIGTTLMKHLIESSRGKYPALSLSVSQSNPAARLYSRLGFVVVGKSTTSFTMLFTL